MTLSLIPSVMNELFFSIRRFNGVSRKSNGCSVKYQGRFIKVSRIGSFKGVSRKFQESLNGVLREFQGFSQKSSKDDFRVF